MSPETDGLVRGGGARDPATPPAPVTEPGGGSQGLAPLAAHLERKEPQTSAGLKKAARTPWDLH